MTPCSVSWCELEVRCRGLCGAHYRRRRDGRDMEEPIRVKYGPGCVAPGCKSAHYGLGMCQQHWATKRNYGESVWPLMGVCAVNSEHPGPFHVDHDHSCCVSVPTCGQCVRGVLCHHCNKALGQVHDDPATLRGLADYLEGNNHAE